MEEVAYQRSTNEAVISRIPNKSMVVLSAINTANKTMPGSVNMTSLSARPMRRPVD